MASPGCVTEFTALTTPLLGDLDALFGGGGGVVGGGGLAMSAVGSGKSRFTLSCLADTDDSPSSLSAPPAWLCNASPLSVVRHLSSTLWYSVRAGQIVEVDGEVARFYTPQQVPIPPARVFSYASLGAPPPLPAAVVVSPPQEHLTHSPSSTSTCNLNRDVRGGPSPGGGGGGGGAGPAAPVPAAGATPVAYLEVTLLGAAIVGLDEDGVRWSDGDAWRKYTDGVVVGGGGGGGGDESCTTYKKPWHLQDADDDEEAPHYRGDAEAERAAEQKKAADASPCLPATSTPTGSPPQSPTGAPTPVSAEVSSGHPPGGGTGGVWAARVFSHLCCCLPAYKRRKQKHNPEAPCDVSQYSEVVRLVTLTLECYLNGAEDSRSLGDEPLYEIAVTVMHAIRQFLASKGMQIPPGHRIDVIVHAARGVPGFPRQMNRLLLEMRKTYAEKEPELRGGAASSVDIVSHWWAVDKDNSGHLDIQELTILMSRLNAPMSSRQLARKLCDFDANGDGELDFFEFVKFYYSLQQREGFCEVLRAAHKKHFGGCRVSEPSPLLLIEPPEGGAGATLAECLLSFRRALQGEDGEGGLEAAEQEVNAWFGAVAASQSTEWALPDFTRYVCSTRNSWVDPKSKALRQADMDYPMSYYFISASHNTYLEGDQLTSKASVDMYREAMLDGVRCIEIDCWTKNGMPMVTHGNTATSMITFEATIKCVACYAFRQSPYPIIISLENHCDTASQHLMAKLLKQYFGSNLVTNLDSTVYTDPKFTPESLKGRVMLRSTQQCVRPLQKLLAFTSGGLTGAENPKEAGSVLWCPSLNNKKSRDFGEKRTDWCKEFTKRHLVRVYPLGTYVKSQNFSPPEVWCAGFQMACLNIQTLGEDMSVHNAMFRQNGRCGYVLKPRALREDVPQRPKVVTVNMIGGGNLPKPSGASEKSEIIDPYVEVKVVGAKCDSATVRTRKVSDNGLDPMWKESFTFPLSFPEAAFFVVTVWDHEVVAKPRYVAEAICPYTALRPGYRSIPLYDVLGRAVSGSFLFVHISISEPTDNALAKRQRRPTRLQSIGNMLPSSPIWGGKQNNLLTPAP